MEVHHIEWLLSRWFDISKFFIPKNHYSKAFIQKSLLQKVLYRRVIILEGCYSKR